MRCSPTPSAGAPTTRFGHEGLRAGGWPPQTAGFGSIQDIFAHLLRGDAFGGGFARGPSPGGDIARGRRGRARRGAGGNRARGPLRGRRRLRALQRQRRRARHPDPHLRALRGHRPDPPADAQRLRPGRARDALRPLRRRRPGRRDALRASATGRGGSPSSAPGRWTCPAGIEDGQRIRIAGAGHAGDAGARPGDLYVEVRVAADERFARQGTELVTPAEGPGDDRDPGREHDRADARGGGAGRGARRAPSTATSRCSRARACRRCAASGAATSTSSSSWSCPRS